jgi:hypothetical protein
MRGAWYNYMQITVTLLKRDLYVLKSTFFTTLIDGAVALTTELILTIHLLPLMGMPRFLIAPIFVGSIYSRLFSLGHNNSIRIQYGIKEEGLPLYEATLPLPHAWLCARSVIRFGIETFLILFPLISVSVLLFARNIGLEAAHWPLLIFFVTTSSLFFAALSIFLGHHYAFNWYLENGWARRLSVMFMTSVLFITWKTTLIYVPWFAYLTLLNPTTYMVEGMRAALLKPEQYLPIPLCIIGTLFFCIVTLWAMSRSIKKRLDLV